MYQKLLIIFLIISLLQCLNQKIEAQSQIAGKSVHAIVRSAESFKYTEPDSLSLYLNKLRNHEGSFLVREYIGYYEAVQQLDDSVAHQLFLSAQKQAIESGDFILAAQICKHLAGIFRKRDQYDAAKEVLNEGLAYLNRKSRYSYLDPVLVKTRLLISLSGIYHQQGDYQPGLEYGHQGEDLATRHQFAYEQMAAAINLAALYGELSSPANAIGSPQDRNRYNELTRQYLTKGAQLAEQLNQFKSAGISYANLGTYYSFQEAYDSSNVFLLKAHALAQQSRYHPLSVRAMRTISYNFLLQEEADSAMFYNRLTQQFADSSGRVYNIANALLSAANIYELQKDLPSAVNSSQQAALLADSIQNYRIASNAYHQLHQLYQQTGNYPEALLALQQHMIRKDSMLSQANYAKIEELRVKYESEQQEAEISQLRQLSQIQGLKLSQQRLWFYGGLVVLILSLLLGWIVFRQLRLRKDQEELRLRQKLLRVQMNPHFLYNALSAIQKQIFWEEDRRKTSDSLARFSQLTRQILDFSQYDFITLEKELDFINNYLEVQRMRFKPAFNYEITVDESLETDELRIPPMITQPFLENAIEHGLAKKKEAGHLSLTISLEEKQLRIVIEDNGVGLTTGAKLVDTLPHQSMATIITRNRLMMLRKSLKTQSRLWIQDLREEGLPGGTRVHFLLPLIYG